MSDFHMLPLAYDDVAKQSGEASAQALWLKNGGTGDYVPGMVAVAGWYLTDSGTLVDGKTEPSRS